MKLAILSGTFNPIHKSHIEVANFVKKKFAYDEIFIIPACNPPLKDDCANANHRLNMVKLAAKNEELTVSEIEFEIEGKSYSYLTVKKLYEKYNISGKLGFIIGTDAYVNLDKWYETDKLKEIVEFIVFEREISFDDNRVKSMINKGYKIIKADLPFKDISSSEIRFKVKKGLNISEYVTKEVEEYINDNGLYK